MEKLRDDFARETDPAKQKAIAEAVQVRAIAVSDAHAARAVVPAGRDAQERRRLRDRAGAGVLEHRNHEVSVTTSGRRFAAARSLRGSRGMPMFGYLVRRLLGDDPRDAGRRGLRLPDAAADARRSGGDHRRRQRHHRAGRARSAAKLGLDRPMLEQFFIWLGNVLTRRFRRVVLLQEDGGRADRATASSPRCRCRCSRSCSRS